MAVVVLVAGCGGDDDAGGPAIDQIEPAVEALEAGEGPQDYFEIFADGDAVTLWVAVDGATSAVAYSYAGGELSSAQPMGGASGPTFTSAEGLGFDDSILHQVLDDFGDDVVDFSIGVEGEAVTYRATVVSDRGGRLGVRLAPDGRVLEAGSLDQLPITTPPASTAP